MSRIIEYLVKWKGYPLQEIRWEPIKAIYKKTAKRSWITLFDKEVIGGGSISP